MTILIDRLWPCRPQWSLELLYTLPPKLSHSHMARLLSHTSATSLLVAGPAQADSGGQKTPRLSPALEKYDSIENNQYGPAL